MMERMKLIINGIYLLLLKNMPYRIVKRNMGNVKGGCSDSELQRLENEIKNRFIKSESLEKREIAYFLQRYGLWNVFPYKFCFNYLLKAAILIRYDKKENLYYAKRNGKKLFLKQNTLTEAVSYYNSILCEQDKNSPHFYNKDAMNGECFFDCGAAEGFLALDVVDKFERIYIFEADKEWVHVLEKTFAPYKNKVKIVNGFLSDEKTDETISLDIFMKENNIDVSKPICIKMDVEGNESKLINGAKTCICNAERLHLIICTYHKQNDAEELLRQIENFEGKIQYEYSKGYMIVFYADDFYPPFLRKGVVHIKK